VMINVIEAAALAAIEHLLPEGYQSLGTRLDIRHFAATPVGMLSIDHLSRTPRARWTTILVGKRADRDAALLVGEQEDVGHLFDQPAFARIGRAAVIDDEGRPVGVVSLTDIERAIRASGLGGPSSDATSLAAR